MKEATASACCAPQVGNVGLGMLLFVAAAAAWLVDGVHAAPDNALYVYRLNYTDSECTQQDGAELVWWNTTFAGYRDLQSQAVLGQCYTDDGTDYIEHANCTRTAFGTGDASCGGEGSLSAPAAEACRQRNTSSSESYYESLSCVPLKPVSPIAYVDRTIPVAASPTTPGPTPQVPSVQATTRVEMSIDLVGMQVLAFDPETFVRGLLGAMNNELAFISRVTIVKLTEIEMRRRKRQLLTSGGAIRVDVVLDVSNEATAGIVSKYFQDRIDGGRLTEDVILAEEAAGGASEDIRMLQMGIARMQIVSPAGVLPISASLLHAGAFSMTGVLRSRTANYTPLAVTDALGDECVPLPSPVVPATLDGASNTTEAAPPPTDASASPGTTCYSVNFSRNPSSLLLASGTGVTTANGPIPISLLNAFIGHSDEIFGLNIDEWAGIIGGSIFFGVASIILLCGMPWGKRKEVIETDVAGDEFFTMNPLHNAIAL